MEYTIIFCVWWENVINWSVWHFQTFNFYVLCSLKTLDNIILLRWMCCSWDSNIWLLSHKEQMLYQWRTADRLRSVYASCTKHRNKVILGACATSLTRSVPFTKLEINTCSSANVPAFKLLHCSISTIMILECILNDTY